MHYYYLIFRKSEAVNTKEIKPRSTDYNKADTVTIIRTRHFFLFLFFNGAWFTQSYIYDYYSYSFCWAN